MLARIPFVVTALTAAFLVVSCSSSDPRRQSAPHRAEERPRMERETEENPEGREQSFWEQRAYPTGTIPIEVQRAAINRELAARRTLAAGEEAWTNLGPAPIRDINYWDSAQDASGRALSLALHPTDPRTLLLGTAQGGIWKSTDRGASWRSVGEVTLPTLAVNIIRYSPADPNVVYAGTGEPNGSTSFHGYGLLRSTDGGETWQSLPARGNGWNFEYAAISGLKFDVRDPNTIYITTASVTINFFKIASQPETGFFKSTDGGMSWTLLRAAARYSIIENGTQQTSIGFMDLEYGGTVAPDLFYVSELYGGILKSEDGGRTWNYVTPRKPTGLGALPADVPHINWLDPTLPGFRLMKRFPHPDTTHDYRRIEIGMSAADPRVLYAGLGGYLMRYDRDGNGVFESAKDIALNSSMLFKSEDGGATWRWLGTIKDGIPDYCGAQCSYDNVITVSPTDPNEILIGGSADYSPYVADPFDSPVRLVAMPWRGMIYRSTDGGKSWLDLTPHCTRVNDTPARVENGMPIYTCAAFDPTRVIHPDVHDIVRAPDGTIYVANDGGVYRGTYNPPVPQPPSTRGGKRRAAGLRTWGPLEGLTYSWENLNNGLSTLQLYRVASHPTDANVILGCMQDNACAYWTGSEWDGWGGADGSVAAFDPKDPKYVYLGYQFAINRHDAGGTKQFDEAAGWKLRIFSADRLERFERPSFVPVFTLDPTEPKIVYAGSDRGIYRSTNRGDDWVRLARGQDSAGVPTSISVSPVDPRTVWVGTNTGMVYRYRIADDGTATAVRYDPGVRRVISAVAASHANADTVYVTFNGYNANTPETPGKVFVSRDAGKTWTNLSSNLPDVPVTSLALHPFDPNRMWISTDVAVYSTADGGTSWSSERRNMPVVAGIDLHYNANTGYLVLATHGRGVWRMKVGTGTTAQH